MVVEVRRFLLCEGWFGGALSGRGCRPEGSVEMTGRSPGKRVAGAALMLLVAALPAAAQRKEPLPKDLEGVGITQHLGAKLPRDVEFTDEDGKPVRLEQYFNGQKPVILTLGYYRCPMLCTLVLNSLVDGLRDLQWTPGHEFEIVTVSIDPTETPTLAKLKKQNYLEDYARPGAAGGWHFLTGREENIRKLADAVGFGYRYVEERGQYAHPAAIFLATPDGRMAKYLYGVVYQPKTVRLALTEAGQGKIGTTADQLLLYCFHYDAQEGRYVLAASNIMRLGGATTALVVGFWLMVSWRRGAHKKSLEGSNPRT
jgi:protein SCO1/2